MNGHTKGLALTLGAVIALAACGGANQGEGAEAPESDPLDTVSGEELYRRGMLLAGADDYVRSEQYLAAAIERGFPEERALPALLNVCIRASRLVAALEYARPYLAQHPSQWPLRLLVASIYMGLDQPERAREELDRVLQDAQPDEPPEAHYFLGVLYRDDLEDADASATHFRRYLALEPEGAHRDEALAALSPEERGLPQRIEMDEVPTPASETEAEGTSEEPDAAGATGGDASDEDSEVES